jgi:multicomponent Na+:H+ antiporter subunit A
LLAGICLYFASLIPDIQQGPLLATYRWSTTFGVNLAFRLDGLSLVFALLITGIGSGVFVYAAGYMQGKANLSGFFTTLTLFTGAMLGLALSDHLIVFFIFWELTSLCSFLLIGYKHEAASTRESARTSLFVTVAGGLLLLVALILMAMAGQSQGLSFNESLHFSQLGQIGLTEHPYYPAILLLSAAGVATKSAQMPLHFWLPAAMAGPTPVSSFLHSATMVKAGILLIARLLPFLGGTLLWSGVYVTFGAVTMLGAAMLAAAQRDIKKILAYSTISVLGILTMLLGIGTELAIKAAVVYLVAHALYKAALFQVAGNIDHAVNSRDLKTLGGLARLMPFTALAALLASLSMAGSPPLFGFFGKELSYMAKLDFGWVGLALITLAVLANILLVGVALSICIAPFWRQATLPADAHPLPRSMALPPLIFGVLGLLVGILPAPFDQYLGTPMATAIAGQPTIMKLKLWHGFNPEALLIVGLSALTLGLGILAASRMKHMMAAFGYLDGRLSPYGPTQAYSKLLDRLLTTADKLTGRTQSGRLTDYLHVTFVGLIALWIIPWFQAVQAIAVTGGGWLEAGLGLMIGVPAIACVLSRHRLTQLTLLGASGFGLVIAFVTFSAADLAMTQILVESLSILFILILLKVSPQSQAKQSMRGWSLAISLLLGAMLSTLIWTPTAQLPHNVAQFYQDNAYSQAFGQNIVNVILVDFRALDTFGEVVAICLAAIGVGALLIPPTRRRSHE